MLSEVRRHQGWLSKSVLDLRASAGFILSGPALHLTPGVNYIIQVSGSPEIPNGSEKKLLTRLSVSVSSSDLHPPSPSLPGFWQKPSWRTLWVCCSRPAAGPAPPLSAAACPAADGGRGTHYSAELNPLSSCWTPFWFMFLPVGFSAGEVTAALSTSVQQVESCWKHTETLTERERQATVTFNV